MTFKKNPFITKTEKYTHLRDITPRPPPPPPFQVNWSFPNNIEKMKYAIKRAFVNFSLITEHVAYI